MGLGDKTWAQQGPSYFVLERRFEQPPISVLHLPEKSGIYHFLINFSSGMGEWYMKVVFDSFDSFQLAEFDFFYVKP